METEMSKFIGDPRPLGYTSGHIAPHEETDAAGAEVYYEPGYTPDEQAEAARMMPQVLDPWPATSAEEICQAWLARVSLGTLDGPIDPGDA